jgi:tetratricopeptide (TPR) repeat protein
MDLERLPESLVCYERSSQIARELGDLPAQASALYNMGRVFRAEERIDDAKDALRFLMDFAPSAPREVTSQALFATMEDGSAIVAIGACHIAPLDNADAVLAPLVQFGSPVATRLERRPYLDVQSDADQRFPYGQNYYWKTHLIKELPDAAIEALVARYRSVPNSKSMIVLQQFGGAVRDIGEADTAFVNRDAEFDFIPAAVWHDGDEPAVLIDWVRGTWSAMRPYSRGVYMNGLGGADDERQEEAFGANEIRLRQIKARYDPTNFFSLNANIVPATAA